jgi:hypothetical protein
MDLIPFATPVIPPPLVTIFFTESNLEVALPMIPSKLLMGMIFVKFLR